MMTKSASFSSSNDDDESSVEEELEPLLPGEQAEETSEPSSDDHLPRRASQAFTFTSRHRRCSSCGRPVAPTRSTALNKGPARLWERAQCREADTADGYAAKTTRAKKALEDEYQRPRSNDATSLPARRQRFAAPPVPHEPHAGQGTDMIKYPDGSRYVGEVKERKRHGKGIMAYGTRVAAGSRSLAV
eukprot:752448-Hanusia_phi.AAC.2